MKTITRAQACAVLATGTAFCGLSRRVFAQTPVTIRLANVPTDGASAPYYAKEMGFFTKAGLDIDIQTLNAASAIEAAVVSGAVDIGYSPLDVLANAHQKGVSLVIIAPASEYVAPAMTRSAALVLAAGSTVQTAKDLNGKVVASNGLHSFGEEAARAMIDQLGGDSSSIKYVEMPFPAMPAAIDAARVDAAFVVEPFLAAARKNGRVLGYGYDAVAKHFIMSAWFTTPAWAKAHPELVRKFVTVMHETDVWANANVVQNGEILAKYLKMDPAVVATMSRAHYAEQLTPALAQPLIDVAAKYNGFKAFPVQEMLYQAPR